MLGMSPAYGFLHASMMPVDSIVSPTENRKKDRIARRNNVSISHRHSHCPPVLHQTDLISYNNALEEIARQEGPDRPSVSTVQALADVSLNGSKVYVASVYVASHG